jgi:acetyl esterase/lipase
MKSTILQMRRITIALWQVPLFQKDFSALPPADVVIAEEDVLRVQIEEYVEKLSKANIPVKTIFGTGQPHGFLTLGMKNPDNASVIEQIVSQLKNHFWYE